MATFNSKIMESALKYDFSHWQGPAGIIPEPSNEAVEKFQREMNAFMEEDDDEEEDEETYQKNMDRSVAIVAEFCQGSPSAEVLKKLPPRVRIGFSKWLFEELSNPELGSAATRTSRSRGSGA